MWPPGAGALRPRRPRLYRAWLGVSLVMLVTPVYYFLLFETDIITLGILAAPTRSASTRWRDGWPS